MLRVSSFNDLEGLKRKTNYQRRPVATGQKLYDDKVSFSLKFWSSNFLGITLDLPFLVVNQCLYSAH